MTYGCCGISVSYASEFYHHDPEQFQFNICPFRHTSGLQWLPERLCIREFFQVGSAHSVNSWGMFSLSLGNCRGSDPFGLVGDITAFGEVSALH